MSWQEVQLVVAGGMLQMMHESFGYYSGDKLMCNGKEGNEFCNP